MCFASQIFFKDERANILAAAPTRPEGKPRRSHGKIGFAELARSIAGKWNKIDADTRAHYDSLAATDKKRYLREMDEWKRIQKLEEAELHMASKKAAGEREFEPLSLQTLLGQSPVDDPSPMRDPSVRQVADVPLSSSSFAPVPVGSDFDNIALGHRVTDLLSAGRSSKQSLTGGWGLPQRYNERELMSNQFAPMAATPNDSEECIAELATKMDGDCVDFLVNMFR